MCSKFTVFWVIICKSFKLFILYWCIANLEDSPIAQLVKNPPAMQEILVQFLGREDPLEKG